MLLDQHWNYSRLKFPICLVSRTGQEMLTFVRSMMEWLGGTVSKEDVGAEGQDGGKSGKGHKRRRDDDNDEDGSGKDPSDPLEDCPLEGRDNAPVVESGADVV